MMSGLGYGSGTLVHGAARTGAVATGLGRGFLVICAVGTMVTLGGNAVGVSSGTLGEVAGQSGRKMTAGEGRGAFEAGAAVGLVVTLEKMWESVWMAANGSLPSAANGVEVGCKRVSASARAAVVVALVELPAGTGQS